MQIGIGLVAIGLGCFDQAVELGRGVGPFGGGAEQPVFSADNEGADGALGRIMPRP